MTLKISYFDARGLTEPIRWILSYGGIEFEDIRAPLPSLSVPVVLPPEIKQKCRWGQVPLAELPDGRQLNQSLAIARYFARKVKLVPEDEFDAALCDEFIDTVIDYKKGWFAVELAEANPAEQEQKKAAQLTTGKEKYLDKFEKIVKENGGKHLVGKSLTWADIYLTQAINHAEIGLNVEILKDLPQIKNLSDNVMNTPGIKEWIAKRPQCKY